jgi:DNA ligase-1
MFKPLLASGEDPLSFPDYFKRLQYPYLCSPKLDGIRCIVKYKKAMSRSFLQLPSYQVQSDFTYIEHLDGELIEGEATDPNVYNRTQSHVMSEDKPGNLKYYAFDYTHPDWINRPFYERLFEAKRLVTAIQSLSSEYIFLEHHEVNNYNELIAYEMEVLAQGYEGVMLRNPLSPYKMGRATFNQNIIYKLKRFKEAEGVLIDVLPAMTNHNPLERDELGYAKRSSRKENLVESEIAGTLIIEFEGDEIEISSGSFTHDQRRKLLSNIDQYRGKLIKFRYFLYGIKNKPRFGRAVGFRSVIDI